MRSIAQMISLRGRKALVTGGAGHIGAAVSQTLLELGADIAIVDRDASACEERATRLRDSASSRIIASSCDLMIEAQTRQMIRDVASGLDGLDIVVHCAAHIAAMPKAGWAVSFDEQQVPAWDDAIRVELTSAFVIAQESRRFLEKNGAGSIILFGSIYGTCGPDMRLYEGTPMANPMAYGASKGGVLQLTRYLATTLAPSIRVNSISPGGVARNQPDAFVMRYIDRTPLQRMAAEEDMKGAVAYLASGLSAYVTGHNVVVDGGWTAW